MAEFFDPYHKWLGIPLDEQPADHYRLLGLRLFEHDSDVIDSAADKAMSHLRSFQNGPRAKLSQKILCELAAARICLLDEKQRAKYDAARRSQLKKKEPRVKSAPPPPGTNTSLDVNQEEVGQGTERFRTNSNTKFFIKRHGKSVEGPFRPSQLKTLAKKGEIDPASTYVRLADNEAWSTAGSVKGLFDHPTEPVIAPKLTNTPNKSDCAEVPVFLPSRLIIEAHVVEGPISIELMPGHAQTVNLGDEWEAESLTADMLEAIETEVENRRETIEMEEDWYTPAGNRRSAPMYLATIRNVRLNKVRQIKKSSMEEARSTADEQLSKWKSQEVRQRTSEAKKILAKNAEHCVARLGEAAQMRVQSIQNLLADGVSVPVQLDWNSYVDRSDYPAFTFEGAPEKPWPPKEPRKPRRGFFDEVLPFLWDKRCKRHQGYLALWEAKCARLDKAWESDTITWRESRSVALKSYQRQKQVFKEEQSERNHAVRNFSKALASGGVQAITKTLEEVFSVRSYPWGFPVSQRVSLDGPSATAVVDLTLPAQEQVIEVCDYKFAKLQLKATPVLMSPEEHEELYDTAVKRAVLRTLWELFGAIESSTMQGAVVNGWVTFIHPATGTEKTSCIISVSASRDQIAKIDFTKVDATECINSLIFRIAGPMSQIAPVLPIMRPNREGGPVVEPGEQEHQSSSIFAIRQAQAAISGELSAMM